MQRYDICLISPSNRMDKNGHLHVGCGPLVYQGAEHPIAGEEKSSPLPWLGSIQTGEVLLHEAFPATPFLSHERFYCLGEQTPPAQSVRGWRRQGDLDAPPAKPRGGGCPQGAGPPDRTGRGNRTLPGETIAATGSPSANSLQGSNSC